LEEEAADDERKKVGEANVNVQGGESI